MDWSPFSLCLVFVGAAVAHRSTVHYKQGAGQGRQDCDRQQKAGLECAIRGIARVSAICSVRRPHWEPGRILLSKKNLKKIF
jgi:hypothetical protein